MNLVSAICIRNKIRVYQLEVIQDNEKALTLYKKQGFQVDRILNCYQLIGRIKEPGIYKAWKREHPENYKKISGQQSKIFGFIRLHGKTQKMQYAQLLNAFLIRLLNLTEK